MLLNYFVWAATKFCNQEWGAASNFFNIAKPAPTDSVKGIGWCKTSNLLT